ncbi:MAG: hypothetical protein MI867_15725, partial [Pseudomonadales bacterium]|nr:hypothetical protein [Pseudomonadales bacterium]
MFLIFSKFIYTIVLIKLVISFYLFTEFSLVFNFFVVLVFFSLLWAFFLAWEQKKIISFLAYTTITNMGFIIIACSLDNLLHINIIVNYIIFYAGGTTVLLSFLSRLNVYKKW